MQTVNPECKNCFSTSLESSDGFIVCQDCGLASDVHIDSNAEWRCFSSSSGGKDLSNVRCGDNTANSSQSLNTYVAAGKDKKQQRSHQWSSLTAKERNMFQIYKEFEQIGIIHDLPRCVVTTATDLYNKLYVEMEKKNFGVKRCNVRQGLKAACLFFSCKQNSYPRERKEIAEMLGNTPKIVTKGCNSYLDIMGIDHQVYMEPFRPVDFVLRFSELLSIPYPYQLKLRHLIEYVETLDSVADFTATSITCAGIYFLSEKYKLGITKSLLHQKCANSQAIITKTYNRLLDFKQDLDQLLENDGINPHVDISNQMTELVD